MRIFSILPVCELQRAAVPQADVIVVLGGSTRTHAFPRPMTELDDRGNRLLYAARLYQQGVADHVLLSGGNVPWLSPRSVPEAETMADILASMGVPREAMWLEKSSRNTHENGVETQKILERQGVSRVILVTVPSRRSPRWPLPRRRTKRPS